MNNGKQQPALKQPHMLSLDNRHKLQITGVTEVESFDEQTVVLHTAQGMLLIRGQGMQMQTLSIDGGEIAVTGTIVSMDYEEPQKTGGFFSRLFG